MLCATPRPGRFVAALSFSWMVMVMDTQNAPPEAG